MSFLTTIPMVFGYPLHIWLGLLLMLLLVWQVYTGHYANLGKRGFLNIHKISAGIFILVAIIHIYYALGLWFFHFTIK
jgi:hypothetical protein